MVYEMDYNYNRYIDDLTGLPNLKGMYRDFMNQDLDGAHFIYVDIDDYNKMNIIFGIDTVEDMLINIASTLQDYCGETSVYRVGNDQFMLITKSIFICEPSELQRILKTPFEHHQMKYVINASVCVINYDDFKGDTIQDILKLAFITHDFARSSGRNTLIYATQEHKEKYTTIREIEYHIHDALEEGDFYPKYRPFVDTFNNEVVGFEATSRWDLNGRMLRPRDFLEIAEWTGVIYDLELKIFEDAMKYFAALKENKNIKLSKRFKAGVNLSLYTLVRLEINDIINLLMKYDIVAKDVIIEIKESYVSDKTVSDKLKNLYELGFVIVLDDYSNSSSSISYLADLEVDVLKISKTLLHDVNKSQQFTHMKSVYQFFTDISKKFNLAVVSTGVETKKDLVLMRELGINIATGDYFLRAVVEEEFTEYLIQNRKRKFR